MYFYLRFSLCCTKSVCACTKGASKCQERCVILGRGLIVQEKAHKVLYRKVLVSLVPVVTQKIL